MSAHLCTGRMGEVGAGVVYMYTHLCTGRKVDVAAGVVSIIMFTCVQVGRKKWVQVLCMYDHLCTGRKGEADAGVVYVCPPVYMSEGGYGCRCCVCIDHLCVGRRVNVAAHLYL